MIFKLNGIRKLAVPFVWIFLMLRLVDADFDAQDKFQKIRIKTFNKVPSRKENVTLDIGELLWN